MDVTDDIVAKWATVRSVARNIKVLATDIHSNLQAPVTAEYIAFALYRNLYNLRNQLAGALDPGLDAYVSGLRGVPTDVIAQANILLSVT